MCRARQEVHEGEERGRPGKEACTRWMNQCRHTWL
jgi:hypothetical protein